MESKSIQRLPTRRSDEVIGSAEAVAFARALAALDENPALRCPDNLAGLLIADAMKTMLVDPQALRAQLDHRFPGAYPFHIARTKFTDEVLCAEVVRGAKQVVILGAGLDTRVFRFEELLTGTCVFEVDFPGNQKQKLERVTGAGLKVPGNVIYVPIDFSRESLASVLKNAGFDPDVQSLFIWDGVSYYLDETSVRNVLEYIGSPSAAPKSVVFDYALRSFVEGDHSSYGSKEVADYFWSKGEPFLFGLNAHETAPFLASCGLRLQADQGPEELGSHFANPGPGHNPLPFVGLYRMAYARTEVTKRVNQRPIVPR